MNRQHWQAALRQANSQLRLQGAYVLGAVEDTESLEVLVNAFKGETDSVVRPAIGWAGKRIQAARQRGHTTLEALFSYFRVDREIATQANTDSDEADKLRQLQNQMELSNFRDQVNQQQKSMRDGMMNSAATLGSSLLLGSPMMMSSAPQADVLSSNLGELRSDSGTRRTPATRPGNGDITLYIKRLQQESVPSKRVKIISDLATVHNNPAALPVLGQLVMQDSSEPVREAAERAAKQIFWGLLYYTMEQDGTLHQEIKRRVEAIRGSAPPAAATDETRAESRPADSGANLNKPASQEDIAAILRKANAKRDQRKS
jgi:hypothetical protein